MNLKGSHLGLNLRLQNEKSLPNSLSYSILYITNDNSCYKLLCAKSL